MPQVIAAEPRRGLGQDAAFQFSTERRQEFINTKLYKGLVLTAGSSSVNPLLRGRCVRPARGHSGRCSWRRRSSAGGVAPGECGRVQNSKVIHRFSGRRFTFGEAGRGRSGASPCLRNPSLRKLSDHAADSVSGCSGWMPGGQIERIRPFRASIFRAPSMLWAAVRHGPVAGQLGGQPRRGSRAQGPPGRAARQQKFPRAWAVVADHYWQAGQVFAACGGETYTQNPKGNQVSTRELTRLVTGGARSAPAIRPPQNHGDVSDRHGVRRPRCWRPSSPFPILYHSCIEPVFPARLPSRQMAARSGCQPKSPTPRRRVRGGPGPSASIRQR